MPTIISLLTALIGAILIASVQISKRRDAYTKLLRTKEIAIGVCIITLSTFFASWMLLVRDMPLSTSDVVTTAVVSAIFGLIARTIVAKIKRKYVVRPHP